MIESMIKSVNSFLSCRKMQLMQGHYGKNCRPAIYNMHANGNKHLQHAIENYISDSVILNVSVTASAFSIITHPE